MTERNTGGPAFPADSYDIERQCEVREEGMTLRDYFAAKAMQQIIHIHYEALTGDGETVDFRSFDDSRMVAEECYGLADAMLEARK